MVDEYGRTIEVKKDCFAYQGMCSEKQKECCKALNALYCKKEVCKFYKPIK